jgi:Zn-finger protein
MTKGYMQIEEGDWIEPSHNGFVDQCCDCHLVHVMQFAVIDRKTRKPVTGVQVQFKLKIDRRRTSASRRKLKFSKEE